MKIAFWDVVSGIVPWIVGRRLVSEKIKVSEKPSESLFPLVVLTNRANHALVLYQHENLAATPLFCLLLSLFLLPC
jgi:hypothetical protein